MVVMFSTVLNVHVHFLVIACMLSFFFLQNYCAFEEWFMPILDTLLEEQKTLGTVWTPSKIIHRLGKEIDNPESVYVIF